MERGRKRRYPQKACMNGWGELGEKKNLYKRFAHKKKRVKGAAEFILGEKKEARGERKGAFLGGQNRGSRNEMKRRVAEGKKKNARGLKVLSEEKTK